MLGCSLVVQIVLVKWEVIDMCRFCRTEKLLMPVIFNKNGGKFPTAEDLRSQSILPDVLYRQQQYY